MDCIYFVFSLVFGQKVWYVFVLRKGGGKVDILEQLFYGKVDPGARNFESGSELEKLLNRSNQNEKLLEAELTEEQKQLYSQISHDSDDIGMLSELTGFKNGFCLGVRLTMAAVCTKLPGEKE